MRTKVRAKLNWIPFEQGGRKTIIIGEKLKYCPIIKYDNEDLAKEAWSVFIDSSMLSGNNVTYITLTYFSDEAPFEKLQVGKEFALFEGRKLVAKGIITDRIS